MPICSNSVYTHGLTLVNWGYGNQLCPSFYCAQEMMAMLLSAKMLLSPRLRTRIRYCWWCKKVWARPTTLLPTLPSVSSVSLPFNLFNLHSSILHSVIRLHKKPVLQFLNTIWPNLSKASVGIITFLNCSLFTKLMNSIHLYSHFFFSVFVVGLQFCCGNFGYLCL